MKTTGTWVRGMQEGRGERDSRPAEREGMQCGFMQVGGSISPCESLWLRDPRLCYTRKLAESRVLLDLGLSYGSLWEKGRVVHVE